MHAELLAKSLGCNGRKRTINPAGTAPRLNSHLNLSADRWNAVGFTHETVEQNELHRPGSLIRAVTEIRLQNFQLNKQVIGDAVLDALLHSELIVAFRIGSPSALSLEFPLALVHLRVCFTNIEEVTYFAIAIHPALPNLRCL